MKRNKKFSGLQVAGIAFLIMVLSVVGTVAIIKYWFFPSPFKPVVLSEKEKIILKKKLEILEGAENKNKIKSDKNNTVLKPEKYTEKNAKRKISFTEREINALLANNTDLANKVAIDLSDNLISAKILLPVDSDFPILGGKTLRFNAGIEISYKNKRPVIKLKGVSIMGIPIPRSWLCGIKGVDIIERYSRRGNILYNLERGVKYLKVKEGLLEIELRE